MGGRASDVVGYSGASGPPAPPQCFLIETRCACDSEETGYITPYSSLGISGVQQDTPPPKTDPSAIWGGQGGASLEWPICHEIMPKRQSMSPSGSGQEP